MKICKKCKKEFTDENYFCMDCGDRLDAIKDERSNLLDSVSLSEKENKEEVENLRKIISDKKSIINEKDNLLRTLELSDGKNKLEKDKLYKELKSLKEDSNKEINSLKKIIKSKESVLEEVINLNKELDIKKYEIKKLNKKIEIDKLFLKEKEELNKELEKINRDYKKILEKKDDCKGNDKSEKKIKKNKLFLGIISVLSLVTIVLITKIYVMEDFSEAKTKIESEYISEDSENSESSEDTKTEDSSIIENSTQEKYGFGNLTNSKDKKMALSVESVKDITKELDEETKKNLQSDNEHKIEQYLLITYGYKNINITEKIMEYPESISDSKGNVYSGFVDVSDFKSPIDVGKGKQQLDAQIIIALEKKIEGNVGVEFSSYYDETNYEFSFEGKVS
ncbi:MAG: hypothetical protein RR561_01060 [Peptostreptococcus sp.]|uniref:hypothetical protein n=1 Tax=Peptostreptococcus sp. TaxID=1262 RepID=UPI002FCC310C